MSPSHDGRSVAADKDEEMSDSTVPATTLELRSTVTDDGVVTLAMNRVDLHLPEADEVVVRIEAAPVNPSDLGMLFAGADIESIETAGNVDLPAARAAIPGGVAGLGGRLGLSMPVGNEGGGTVVATGESAAARALAGKVVGFLSGSTYAQYRTVNVASCLPMHNGTRADDAAACFVNPLTALGMVETMRLERHSGLVHTVGASNLGLMLNRICLADDVPLVNIVRRAEHVELLRVQGAHHVVDSSAATFFADLVDALRVTGATIAFDAIGGGELASTLLAAMEKVASEGDVFSRYGSDTHKQISEGGYSLHSSAGLVRTGRTGFGRALRMRSPRRSQVHMACDCRSLRQSTPFTSVATPEWRRVRRHWSHRRPSVSQLRRTSFRLRSLPDGCRRSR